MIIGGVFDGNTFRYGCWNPDGSFREFLNEPVPDGTRNLRFNNLGQAIGILDDGLVLYDGTTWSQRSIVGLGDYTLSSISDFNDRGEFVGLVRQPGANFEWGFVARPVPEPGSLAIFAIGLIAVGACGRRRHRAIPASSSSR